MKKTITVISLLLVSAVIFCSCNKQKASAEPDEKVLETAEQTVNVSSQSGTVTLTEDSAKALLGCFDKETLMLSDDLSEYKLNLTGEKIMNQEGCKAEAVKEGSDTPERTFAIIGSDCYVYNDSTGKYFLLTTAGAVEVVSKTANENGFTYDKENSDAISELFKPFTKEQLGLEKELSEYVFITVAEVTKDSDGKEIYIIEVYENDGRKTDVRLGFNETAEYVLNPLTNEYDKLS